MKTVIVTGANSGLGLWTSKYLLDHDYKVIMACRDLEKTKKAIQHFPLFDQTKTHELKRLDLADYDSIKHFVSELNSNEPVYGLICNAGISYEGPFRYTKNGIEETFGTNYLGHFLLTNLLLEKFKPQRIIFVSSELHNPKNKSPFAKAKFSSVENMAHPTIDPSSSLSKQTQSFYATSKLCMILFAHELERRLFKKEPTYQPFIGSINPGLMLGTNLGRTHKPGENIYRKVLDLVFKLIGLSDNPEQSGKSVFYLIHQSNLRAGYYDTDKKISSSEDSYDENKAKILWEGSEKLLGLSF
jgi:NAD(P)-dependent dehydrogenase (short-subunit alcohol dehydrogenase family)